MNLRQPLPPYVPVLFIVMAIIAAIHWLYVEPSLLERQQNLAALLAQQEEMQQRLNNTGAELQTIRMRRIEYEKLLKADFIGEQDRLTLARRIDNLRLKHKLSGLAINMLPASEIAMPTLNEAGFKLQSTIIELNLAAFLDTDITAFIDELRASAGTSYILAFDMQKAAGNMSSWRNSSLEQLAQTITGKVTLIWLSAVPQAQGATP